MNIALFSSSRTTRALALVVLASTIPALAATWQVAKSGVDTPTCGATIATACLTIQYTLDNRVRKYDSVVISPGTYSEALNLTKSVILNGLKTGVVTVNAQGTNTAVMVNGGVLAELEYMTITGGFQGANVFYPVGGISNNGSLALYEVKVEGNSSAPDPSNLSPGFGGIFNDGTLDIYASTISGNSVSGGCDDVGGIENYGTLFMDYSTLSGNTTNGAGSCSAGPGGIIGSTDGLFNLGNVTIDTTLVSGNTISTNGGSLTITRSTLTGSGTALNLYQPALIVNSTIAGNGTAMNIVTGFYGYSGSASLFNSTVANNSVGVSGSDYSFVSLQNTILAGNGTDCGGGTLYGSYNIVQNDSGCATLDPSVNLLGISPALGPLRYNDGPTPTMMPLVGSPAINAGSPSGCTDQNGKPLTFDQRVLPRPQPSGGACDIGAVEVQPHDPGRY
jgi:hypothetical protein